MKIRIAKLDPCAKLPSYKKQGDSGMDLCVLHGATIPPGMGAKVATGIAMEIPPGFEGQIRPRSGLSERHRIVILGTIDSNYRGDVSIQIYNYGEDAFVIEKHGRIAQLVISPVIRAELEEVKEEELTKTERGTNGFGSSGI